MSSRLELFSDEHKRRFDILTGKLTTDENFWTAVFALGGFIAGGAALFVGDDRQCINDVGDIDIWLPASSAAIEDLVTYLFHWFQESHIDYACWWGDAVCTIERETMRVQFIRIKPTRPEVHINSFDLTYVQAAIVPLPPENDGDPDFESLTNLSILGLLSTDQARSAWSTRVTTWNEQSKLWQPRDVEFMDLHWSRVEKLVQKGFTISGGGSMVHIPNRPVHTCAPEHRTQMVPTRWWGNARNIETIHDFSLAEFDESNYREQPKKLA